MASPEAQSCSVCGTLTTKRCSRCSEGVDTHGNVHPSFYCSKERQTADWNRHKVLCRQANARKQLYLGAGLIQKAFYICRRAGFDIDIINIKKQGGKLVPVERSQIRLIRGQFPLYDFPDHLVSNDNDKAALLSVLSCEGPLIYLGLALEKVLKGICGLPDLEELTCNMNTGLRVSSKHHNACFAGEMAPHMLLGITVVGQQYVLDPSGAQFEPNTMKYGTACTAHNNLAWEKSLRGRGDAYPPSLVKERCVFEKLSYIMTAWESQNQTTIAAMLNAKESKFQVPKTALLDEIQAHMDK